MDDQFCTFIIGPHVEESEDFRDAEAIADPAAAEAIAELLRCIEETNRYEAEWLARRAARQRLRRATPPLG
jgi:hypothetical protein